MAERHPKILEAHHEQIMQHWEQQRPQQKRSNNSSTVSSTSASAHNKDSCKDKYINSKRKNAKAAATKTTARMMTATGAAYTADCKPLPKSYSISSSPQGSA